MRPQKWPLLAHKASRRKGLRLFFWVEETENKKRTTMKKNVFLLSSVFRKHLRTITIDAKKIRFYDIRLLKGIIRPFDLDSYSPIQRGIFSQEKGFSYFDVSSARRSEKGG